MTRDAPAALGWNTWDVRYHSGWTHLPERLRVRFGIIDETGAVIDDFTWRRGFDRVGPHTIDGRYSQVSVRAAGTRLVAEAASLDDELLLAFSGDRAVRLALIVNGATLVESADGRVDFTVAGEPWHLDASVAAEVESTDVDEITVRLSMSGSALARVVAGRGGSATNFDAVRRGLGDARLSALDTEVSSSGWLGEAGQAMSRAVTWNTIYAPDLHRVLTPTSRDFVSRERDGFYGSWAIHAWDTFFTGLIAGKLDTGYAAGIFDQILAFADDRGMLPNRVSDDGGTTHDRSQPPVGAVCVLDAYLASGLSDETRDRALLVATFEGLEKWHAWWPAQRVGPFGVLAWGSDPIEGDPDSATMDRTRRESGLDDSPMYDDVIYVPELRTMDLADVGLNALHIADARALAQIARALGEAGKAARYEEEAAAASVRFDEVFWDDSSGLYLNRRADGSFSPSVSPTMLYPLLAGVPSRERAEAVARALLRPEVLGGSPPLPSVARNDPGFDSRYWRGRIWGPIAYLAIAGLRRYDLQELVSPVVDGLLDLFLREWTDHGHVRENYPVVGDDVRALAARSDGLMAWGGLLGLLGIEELVRAETTGWRFAHPGRDASVSGLHTGDGSLGAEAARDRVTVSLDGRSLVEFTAGVTLRSVTVDTNGFRALAHGDGNVTVFGPGSPSTVSLTSSPQTIAIEFGAHQK